jgi:hypothetical protein
VLFFELYVAPVVKTLNLKLRLPMMNTEKPKDAVVLDFASFRRKKTDEQDLTRGRSKPLYVSHKDGVISANPGHAGTTGEDFGDRVSRIKASLERINSLMAELKKMSASEPQK